MIKASNDLFTIQLGMEESDYEDFVIKTFKENNIPDEIIKKYFKIYKLQSSKTKDLLRYIHPISLVKVIQEDNLDKDKFEFSFLYSIFANEDKSADIVQEYKDFFERLKMNT